MKVLLDENLPHALRLSIPAHEVFTASYAGFGGLKNGLLLQAAEDAGFEVLVTGDQTLSYEQNLARRKIAIVALSAIGWRIIKPHVAQIAAAVDAATPGAFTRIECGTFSRRRPKPPGPRPS